MRPPRRRVVLFILIGALLISWAAVLLLTPSANPQSAQCDREPNGHAIVVNLDNVDNRETISHVREAVAAGKPRYLHWRPDLADAHRAAALRGIPTAPLKDRDEYPPAATFEGGAGSDVKLISRADNRSSGSRMGAVMRPYCFNQAFILEP